MRNEPVIERIIAWGRRWGLTIGYDVPKQNTAKWDGPWMHGINWDGSIFVERSKKVDELPRAAAALAHELAHVLHHTSPDDSDENELLGVERAIYRECAIPISGWVEWMQEYLPYNGSAEWWFLTQNERRRILYHARRLAIKEGLLDKQGKSTFQLPTTLWWNQPLKEYP